MIKSDLPKPLISAGDAWKDQRDINHLLRHPRKPSRPDRVYTVNNKYGFGLCIKRFAGLSEQESLPGIVPHGVGTYGPLDESPQAPPQELLAKVPCVFASNSRCAEGFRNSGKKYVLPIGLASTYAYACLEQQVINARGSLFFRSHSTQSIIGEINDKEAIEWLRSLPKKFHPIRISAFPFDLGRGAYKPYEDAGFKLVSAGTEYDQLFIWRHLHLIRGHRQILSTGMGTHIFHSIMCGKPVLIRQLGESYKLINKNFSFNTEAANKFQKLATFFGTEVNTPTAAQIQLTQQFLGTAYTLPPDALRRVIDLAQDIHNAHQARHLGAHRSSN